MSMQRLWALGVLLTTILVVPLLAGTKTWTGASSGDWGVAGNWSGGIPVDGDDLVFPISSNTASFNQPDNNTLSNLKVRSITFWTNTVSPGPLTLAGNAFTLDGSLGAFCTLSNANITAGRDVTISNAITISGDQRWSGRGNKNGIIVFAGNLSGAGGIIATNMGDTSNFNGKGAVRFGGSNATYTGTIRVTTSSGVTLLSPAAMIGGLIDLIGSTANLHLIGNTADNPYRFTTDSIPGATNVNFGQTGSSGMYQEDGDIYWDPSAGGNYTWPTGTLSTISINGSSDAMATPHMVYFGNTNGNLVLTGDRTLSSQVSNTGGNNPGHLTIQFALEDDATGGRLLNIGPYNSILTRPAVEHGATHSRIAVTETCMLSLSNMNQIFSGNLSFNKSGIIFNGITWADFVNNRSAGYGAFIATGSTLVTPITATAGGSLTAGAYSYRVVTVTDAGTSAAGAYKSGTTAGSNLTLPISWAAQTGATAYRLYRHTANANFTVGDLIYEGNNISVSDDGLPALQSGVTLPTSNTTVGDHAWAVSVNGIGFAARGAPVTITDQGTTALTFDRNFFLGSPIRQSDGSVYADAPVILNRGAGKDTITLSATADRTINTFGPSALTAAASGYYNLAEAGPIHEIAGRITGGGAGRKLILPGNLHNAGAKNTFALLRLSNTGNTYQATLSLDNGDGNYNYGILIATDDRAFGDAANPTLIRSDYSSSLGGLGWLVLLENTEGGDKSFGRTLTISNANATVTSSRTAGIGAYRGNVVYTGTVNCVGTAITTNYINLHVEPTAVLKLGSGAVAATLANNCGPSTGGNYYRKRGEGTLVLQNLTFADAGGNTHVFQIGRSGGGLSRDGGATFDGAVRETGNAPYNSMTNQNILLAGGVLETSDSLLGGAFTRGLGAGPDQIRWDRSSGGGFAAYDGPLTVNIGGQATPLMLTWDNTPSFLNNNKTLMFGSRTATDVVTWLNPQSQSASAYDSVEIRVIDNPATNTDRAVIRGVITGGLSTGNPPSNQFFDKGGDGVLEFPTGVTHWYTNTTRLYAGTLVVNGTIAMPASKKYAPVYVLTNAALGGSGRIDRDVLVSGGILSPGDVAPSNVVGTLTITNLTMSADSKLNLDLGTPGASDKLVVLGSLTLAGTINVTNVTGFASGSYEIATYVGTLNNTAVLGALPPGVTATINTDTAGKVYLDVAGAGGSPRGTLLIIR
jgi:hypothetical protein